MELYGRWIWLLLVGLSANHAHAQFIEAPVNGTTQYIQEEDKLILLEPYSGFKHYGTFTWNSTKVSDQLAATSMRQSSGTVFRHLASGIRWGRIERSIMLSISNWQPDKKYQLSLRQPMVARSGKNPGDTDPFGYLWLKVRCGENTIETDRHDVRSEPSFHYHTTLALVLEFGPGQRCANGYEIEVGALAHEVRFDALTLTVTEVGSPL